MLPLCFLCLLVSLRTRVIILYVIIYFRKFSFKLFFYNYFILCFSFVPLAHPLLRKARGQRYKGKAKAKGRKIKLVRGSSASCKAYTPPPIYANAIYYNLYNCFLLDSFSAINISRLALQQCFFQNNC